jgi:hypothetical protein
MKQRFLYGLDVIVCLYLIVVLRLALIGGFTLSVGPVRVSVRSYTNLFVALVGLLTLRHWFRGSFFHGFRLPSQLLRDRGTLLRTGRQVAAYAVEIVLMSVLAFELWVALFGSLTLPLGIVEVTVPLADLPTFLFLAALFVLRHVLGGGISAPLFHHRRGRQLLESRCRISGA